MGFNSISKTSGSIPSTENLSIHYDLYVPAGSSRSFPVILFLHGFKGFKDWGPFPTACEELSSGGFAVIAMNFSLNGVGESMVEFEQLDLFARETFSQDLNDVGSVIEALKDGTICTEKAGLNTDLMGILGHSRGGHTAVVAAAEHDEIACLVTWSAVADYNARWTDQMITDWEAKGYTDIMNGRTGQVMRVDKVVYDDIQANADRLIALNRIKGLHIPSLFIHSRDDESVPYQEAQKLYKGCPCNDKEIKLLQGTGHTFGGVHPFEAEDFPEPFDEVLDHTINWFQYYLQ